MLHRTYKYYLCIYLCIIFMCVYVPIYYMNTDPFAEPSHQGGEHRLPVDGARRQVANGPRRLRRENRIGSDTGKVRGLVERRLCGNRIAIHTVHRNVKFLFFFFQLTKVHVVNVFFNLLYYTISAYTSELSNRISV